uniref:Uncharacterized protein n=1 Tax=Glossina brevipalpis TaxID=37001 RepID=A0A1A9WAS9_9MUSC
MINPKTEKKKKLRIDSTTDLGVVVVILEEFDIEIFLPPFDILDVSAVVENISSAVIIAGVSTFELAVVAEVTVVTLTTSDLIVLTVVVVTALVVSVTVFSTVFSRSAARSALSRSRSAAADRPPVFCCCSRCNRVVTPVVRESIIHCVVAAWSPVEVVAAHVADAGGYGTAAMPINALFVAELLASLSRIFLYGGCPPGSGGGCVCPWRFTEAVAVAGTATFVKYSLEYGDCWRCVVGSKMRLPPAVIILLVPHELLFPGGGTFEVLCDEFVFDTVAPALDALLSN